VAGTEFPVKYGGNTSLKITNFIDILKVASVIMFTTFFVRFQGTDKDNAPKPAPLATMPPAPLAPVTAAVVVAPVVVGAAAVVAPVVVAPVVVGAAAVVGATAVVAPIVVAAAVVVGAAAAVSAAVLASAVVAPAAVATAKKRKHYLCRLEKCPQCGLRATSNRQLACSGDLCGHVYLPPSKYKKAKLHHKKAAPQETDMTIEELDGILDGTGPLSLSMDIFDFMNA